MLTLRVHMLHYARTLRQPTRAPHQYLFWQGQPGSSLLLGRGSLVSSRPVSMTPRDAQPRAVPGGCPATLGSTSTWGRALATYRWPPASMRIPSLHLRNFLSPTFSLTCGFHIFHFKPQPGYMASAGYPDAAEHIKCECQWYVHIPSQLPCSGPISWCLAITLQLKVP